LRSDSTDQEEVWLAAACYEASHHGTIGADCVALSGDAVMYAQRHSWPAAKQRSLHGDHRYLVTERREREEESHTEIAVTFKYHATRDF